jgi:hypothetical protein
MPLPNQWRARIDRSTGTRKVLINRLRGFDPGPCAQQLAGCDAGRLDQGWGEGYPDWWNRAVPGGPPAGGTHFNGSKAGVLDPSGDGPRPLQTGNGARLSP